MNSVQIQPLENVEDPQFHIRKRAVATLSFQKMMSAMISDLRTRRTAGRTWWERLNFATIMKKKYHIHLNTSLCLVNCFLHQSTVYLECGQLKQTVLTQKWREDFHPADCSCPVWNQKSPLTYAVYSTLFTSHNQGQTGNTTESWQSSSGPKKRRLATGQVSPGPVYDSSVYLD